MSKQPKIIRLGGLIMYPHQYKMLVMSWKSRRHLTWGQAARAVRKEFGKVELIDA